MAGGTARAELAVEEVAREAVGRHRAPAARSRRRLAHGKTAKKAGFRLVGFLGVVMLVFAGLAVLPRLVPNLLVRALADQSAAPAAKPRVGDAIAIDSGAGRPDLSWRVDGVRKAGRQFVVDLAIADKGDAAWTWDEGTQISVVDAQGVGHVPHRIPQGLTLMPGQTRRAHVRFSVPGQADLAKVVARVGPGLPQPATWLVP